MRTVKIIYLLGVLILAFVSYLLLKNGWNGFGILTTLVTVMSLINYIDIEQTNKSTYSIKSGNRRAEYFKNLSDKEKQEYLDKIKEKSNVVYHLTQIKNELK